jgi:cathepsin B
MGCNGGWPHAAWTHIKNAGLSTGWLYNTSSWCKPYSFAPCDHHTTGRFEPCGAVKPTPKCEKSCVSGYETEYKKDLHYAKEIYSISKNVSEIQTEILTNGPVEASFDVYEDFLTYKSGVYHHIEGKNLGGHSIKILGWGVEANTPYWLVANSWNEDWGEKGFFKIKRGNNECGIEGGIVAGIPKMY